MKLQEEYSNLHNTNQGLSDKAGTSNAHISFKDKLRLLKYKHFFLMSLVMIMSYVHTVVFEKQLEDIFPWGIGVLLMNILPYY